MLDLSALDASQSELARYKEADGSEVILRYRYPTKGQYAAAIKLAGIKNTEEMEDIDAAIAMEKAECELALMCLDDVTFEADDIETGQEKNPYGFNVPNAKTRLRLDHRALAKLGEHLMEHMSLGTEEKKDSAPSSSSHSSEG